MTADMRPETASEQLARDIRDGRFPEQSEPQMVPVVAPFMGDATTPPNIVNWPEDRDALISAVWRCGFGAGRVSALQEELARLKAKQGDTP